MESPHVWDSHRRNAVWSSIDTTVVVVAKNASGRIYFFILVCLFPRAPTTPFDELLT